MEERNRNPMITLDQYKETKARENKFNTWVDTQRNPRNGWASYKEEDIPTNVPRITNEERSALEVYEFINTPPTMYFLYIKEGEQGTYYGASATATTWTGDKLGDVQCGNQWRDNFGSVRVSVRVYAINGKEYAGTYYKSAGSYARVKLCKHRSQ